MSKNDDLVALSSVELRRRIGSKEISPVELTEASIARMEALNPSVNAICATAYGRARREAKAAEKAALAGEPLGPLHGLPTGIKDLHDIEGLLTTHGSPWSACAPRPGWCRWTRSRALRASAGRARTSARRPARPSTSSRW